jgi:hypothetical protein
MRDSFGQTESFLYHDSLPCTSIRLDKNCILRAPAGFGPRVKRRQTLDPNALSFLSQQKSPYNLTQIIQDLIRDYRWQN